MGNLKGLEINPTNLELIKLAKELAYNDYNNRKAELHNRWLAESDMAWRKNRVKVAYPTIPNFPDEDEILDRARKLIEFLDTHRPDLVPKEETVHDNVEPVETPPKEEVPQPVVEQPQPPVESKTTEEKPQEEIRPETDLDYARMKVARKTGDSNVTNKVIPSVINKLQELRNSWR